jgi:hypothetical protein
MMDKVAEKQISVGFLNPYLFTSTNILSILSKLAKQSQMQ